MVERTKAIVDGCELSARRRDGGAEREMPATTQEQVVGIRRSGVTGVAVNGHQFRVVCRPVAAPWAGSAAGGVPNERPSSARPLAHTRRWQPKVSRLIAQ